MTVRERERGREMNLINSTSFWPPEPRVVTSPPQDIPTTRLLHLYTCIVTLKSLQPLESCLGLTQGPWGNRQARPNPPWTGASWGHIGLGPVTWHSQVSIPNYGSSMEQGQKGEHGQYVWGRWQMDRWTTRLGRSGRSAVEAGRPWVPPSSPG